MREYPNYEVPDEVGLPAYWPRKRVLHIRPEVAAWRRKVMKEAWRLFKSKKAKDMKTAIKKAYAKVKR